MFAFLTSVVGIAAVCGYLYVAAMFARASYKAGNSFLRVVLDGVTWPVMGWPAIEKLYKTPPAS